MLRAGAGQGRAVQPPLGAGARQESQDQRGQCVNIRVLVGRAAVRDAVLPVRGGHCSVLLVEYWNSWYVLEYIVVCIVEFIGMYWHGMYCGIYCFWYLLQVLVCICMY